MGSDRRTTIQHALSVEVEIEADESVTPGIVASHDTYAHFFINALLSNEDVTRDYFLRYPEVARVQYYVDDVIRMDLRRPDDALEERDATMKKIEQKFPHLKSRTKSGWAAPAGTDCGHLAEFAGGGTDGTGTAPPSIQEYPREVVCLGCLKVVAYARATVVIGKILRSEIVRADGVQPREGDPLCLNCGESQMGIFRLTGGGPFTVRDRARTCLHCGGSGVGLADSGDVNAPPCACCGGDGKIDAGGFHTVQDCPTCGGRGRQAAQADRDAMVPPCPTCHGTGKDPDNVDTSHCSTCKGTGRTPGVGFATFGEDPCPDCNGQGCDHGHVDDGAPNPPRCQTCWGTGTAAPAKDQPCPTCNGTGKV